MGRPRFTRTSERTRWFVAGAVCAAVVMSTARPVAAHTEIELHACCSTTLEHCDDARPPSFSEACRAGHRVLDSGCDDACCLAHLMIFDPCPGIIGCGGDPCPCEPDIPTGSVAETANGIDDDCDGFVDDEQCDGVDNDGDGLVDEDIGSCLMRILFVPMAWEGTQAEFESTAALQFAVFLNNLHLNACPDNFSLEFLNVNDINLPAPSCATDCGANEVRDAFTNSSSINLADFDVVAAMTDGDPCDSTAGCSNVLDFVWLETDESSVLAHELGHMLGLGDEYCSREAGSTCGLCNDGAAPPPNFLGADLDCDPAGGGDCCDDCSGSQGMCIDDVFTCCDGNLSPAGGRCIMSSADADGPRGFDERCFGHATNPPNPRSMANPNGQIPMDCAFAHLGHERSLDMDLEVEPNGQMAVKTASTGMGRLGIGGVSNQGRFEIEILDSQGSVLYATAFDPRFRPDPQFAGVDYSAVHYATASRGLRAAIPTSVDNLKIQLSVDNVVTSQTCLVPGGSAPNGRVLMEADSTPPTIACPPPITVECAATNGTPATDPMVADFLAAASADDDCDPAPTVDNDAPPLLPLGTTVVTFVAKDADGNSDPSSTCQSEVTVIDTTPPTIDSLTPDPASLWPPNHKMIAVEIDADASDICDPAPVCAIGSVASNEPVNGSGDGNTSPDWQIVDDLEVRLRAERSGRGNGRVYTTEVTCADQSGNQASDDTSVSVAHDRR